MSQFWEHEWRAVCRRFLFQSVCRLYFFFFLFFLLEAEGLEPLSLTLSAVLDCSVTSEDACPSNVSRRWETSEFNFASLCLWRAFCRCFDESDSLLSSGQSPNQRIISSDKSGIGRSFHGRSFHGNRNWPRSFCNEKCRIITVSTHTILNLEKDF